MQSCFCHRVSRVSPAAQVVGLFLVRRPHRRESRASTWGRRCARWTLPVDCLRNRAIPKRFPRRPASPRSGPAQTEVRHGRAAERKFFRRRHPFRKAMCLNRSAERLFRPPGLGHRGRRFTQHPRLVLPRLRLRRQCGQQIGAASRGLHPRQDRHPQRSAAERHRPDLHRRQCPHRQRPERHRDDERRGQPHHRLQRGRHDLHLGPQRLPQPRRRTGKQLHVLRRHRRRLQHHHRPLRLRDRRPEQHRQQRAHLG